MLIYLTADHLNELPNFQHKMKGWIFQQEARVESVSDGDGFADLAGQDQLLNSLSITYAVPVFGYVLKLKFTKIMKDCKK